ncbi:STAS-like domain-containing protein [Chromobacterium vaccinii]|nr:STAS-like domain-containing protein [Chromobacterium vaccinii]
MEKIVRIDIATEFSRVPAGRYLADGPYSGERFRSSFLTPALERADKVEICLDGVRGYGSSFLEEAFGGLARLHRWTVDQLLQKLAFISEDDPTVIDEIKSYLEDERGAN